MMKVREIQYGPHAYPFHHGMSCTDDIVQQLLALDADRYVLVVDQVVANLHPHLAPIAETLARHAPITTITLPAGERGKVLATVGSVIEGALASGMTRRSCVVAMGGGVIGNIAGLAAATAFRGVRFVHLPTTLIAALDSVLSLKQAVNGRLGKNLIGTFYPPTAVLLDYAWLSTLPERERRSGLCEMVKNALAIVPERRHELAAILRPDCWLEPDELAWLVDFGIDAKQQVMRYDEHECGTGLVLEYGHTIGHALELAAPGALSHGEAVGIGMLCAADIAHRSFDLSSGDHRAHRDLLELVGVDEARAAAIPTSTVLRLVRFDNKRGYAPGRPDELPMILLDALGRPRGAAGPRPLVGAPFADVERVVNGLAATSAMLLAKTA
jgi:3-dehydroquinate synthetase